MNISPVRPATLPRRATVARPAPLKQAVAPARPKPATPAAASSESRLGRIAHSLFAGGGIGMGVGALACAGLTAFGVAGGLLAFQALCVAGLAAGALYGIWRTRSR